MHSLKQYKIYDSVHGFIRFNEIERELIDSLPFQRLHYIHQLGIAYLVYPGATHTRFEHSLGVMELASSIFDRATAKPTFSLTVDDYSYWRQVLRLAALCHDLGHLPFSHVAEKALLGKEGHEKWTLAIIASSYLAPIWKLVETHFSRKNVLEDVIKLSIGEKKLSEMCPGKYSFSAWERVVSQMITADFFGADRIDYLLRDAQCTGVSYGLFDYHQLIEMLCILPREQDHYELGIEENGIESCEALLLARHFMHKRVYQYSSVKAYSFHLTRFMSQVFAGIGEGSVEEYIGFTESEVLAALTLASKDCHAIGHKDAHALVRRQNRFKAIQLPPTWQKSLAFPEESICYEFVQNQKKPLRLSFPVLKRNQKILDASAFSTISIPLESVSWAYVSPDHEKPLLESLEKAQ